LLASVIARARSLSDRIPGCQFLALITGAESTYFERCFQVLPGCTAENRRQVPDSATTIQFCQLMREVSASGSLAEMLSVIVVCEWSYWSWAQRVSTITTTTTTSPHDTTTTTTTSTDHSPVRDNFVLYEWIDLHHGTHFTAVVEYLRNLLDQEAVSSCWSEEERNICQQRFLQVVQLEHDFFEDAYANTGMPNELELS
jgi:thiaminase (transcriptional activator TenA)